MTATVRVPASTSNLGPGFDALGLALDRYLVVVVDLDLSAAVSQNEITREGDSLFAGLRDEDDLFLEALRTRRASRGSAARAVRAVLRSDIPTGRGLGSSAAAVVAGVMSADALDGVAHSPESVLVAAAKLEGHADNVAPAVYGGLCAAYTGAEGSRALRLGVPPRLRAVVASPEGSFPTKASRAVLPASVSHRDATANLGRAVYLSHALVMGSYEDLGWAFDDALHQPYRATLLPGLTDAIAAARTAGALGASLSGAGSSCVALVADDADGRVATRVGEAMIRAYATNGVTAAARVHAVDGEGARVVAT